jgi:hypothetical protein
MLLLAVVEALEENLMAVVSSLPTMSHLPVMSHDDKFC